MKILKIFTLTLMSIFLVSGVEGAREEKINKIEVFVSSYCYRINKSRGPEILILKRSPKRAIYPNIWECSGGAVCENESFEDATKRQLLEETGIMATKWKVLECFETEIKPNMIVPGIAFCCKSGDSAVTIDPQEHVDFRWVTLKELDNYPLVSQQMRQTMVRLLIQQGKFF